MITTFQAVILGVVEGLTEFLPVSSMGHMILVSHALGIHGEAVKTFEVVIQSGALLAVLWLYWDKLLSMVRAVIGRDPTGLRLFFNLAISSLPIVLLGAALHHWVKTRLFNTGPVVIALAVGGILMIILDRRLRESGQPTRGIGALTWRDALVIGVTQCFALWPGTSRAMVTILAGMWVGLPAAMAAEYSFLLALPSLGAAVAYDTFKGGAVLAQQAEGGAILSGFVAAVLVAMLAIRGFIVYLQNHGIAVFGWYRLVLALIVWRLLT